MKHSHRFIFITAISALMVCATPAMAASVIVDSSLFQPLPTARPGSAQLNLIPNAKPAKSAKPGSQLAQQPNKKRLRKEVPAKGNPGGDNLPLDA